MSTEQRTASLLSLIASKAIVPGGFADVVSAPGRERSDAELEEQRAQTMMYAARMKYLQDSDAVKPDTLFMTRKQAQKLVKQDSLVAMSLRKIDVGGKASVSGAGGGSDPKGGAFGHANNTSPNWKKQRGLQLLDDRHQTWVPITQAGCHFWQSQETGECRTVAPGEWQGRVHPDLPRQDGDEEEDTKDRDDDTPFPESFAFLNKKH